MGKQLTQKQCTGGRVGPHPTLPKAKGIFGHAATESAARKLNQTSEIAWLFCTKEGSEAEIQLLNKLKRAFIVSVRFHRLGSISADIIRTGVRMSTISPRIYSSKMSNDISVLFITSPRFPSYLDTNLYLGPRPSRSRSHPRSKPGLL